MPDSSNSIARSWNPWLLPAALFGLGALGWACRDDGSGSLDTTGGDLDGEVSRRDVLHSIAHQVVVPATADFADAAASLRRSTEAHAAASPDDPAAVATARDEVQLAWREAMEQWQGLEMMQVGPAAPALTGVGGEDLRDAIYSWPTVDTCSVDRALVNEAYAADDFLATQLVWAYGLDALEYLLFVEPAEHSCPAQVQLDEPWAALSSDERARRRVAYAQVIAGALSEQAAALAARWSPEGDDFAAALARPGEGASPYGSDAEALDDVFRAMFYVDKQTKDGKLGAPLGVVAGCTTAPCPELMEAPWSGAGAGAVAANLRGLKAMVQGGPDPAEAAGFDDLLGQLGEEALADTLLSQIDAAIAQAEAFDAPLQEVVVGDPARVEALHAAVREVTTTLKGPFVMALMLTIPAEGAGDND